MNGPIPASEPQAPTMAPGAGRAGATGPPGDDTGPPAFASVLDSQVARTALAEGQKNTGQSSGTGRDGRGQDSAETTTHTGTSTDAVAANLGALQAAAAALSTVVRPTSGAATGAGTTASPAGADQAGSATPQALPGASGSTGGPPASSTTAATALDAPALATGNAQTATGDQDGASPLPAPSGHEPTSGQPATNASATTAGTAAASGTPLEIPLAGGTLQAGATAALTDAARQPGQSTAPTVPPGTAPQPAASAGSESTLPPQGSTSAQSAPAGTPTATPVSSHAAATAQPPDALTVPATPGTVHAANAAVQTDAGSAQPNPSTDPTTPVAVQNLTMPSTAAAPASTGAAAQGAGVGLAHAIETVRMTIEMAANRGYSQARIELSPPELGSIRIHLHQTADGLIARVVAEHASAAQTLQQGGGDLRRSLEDAGLPLLRLDIETSGQQGAQPRDPQSASSGTPRDSGGSDEPNDTAPADAGAVAHVRLPGGAIVDILA